MPSPDTVRSRLQDLVDETGIDAFKRVVIDSAMFYVVLAADDGGDLVYVQGHDKKWELESEDEVSSLSSPSPCPLAELPLDHLPDYAELLSADLVKVTYVIDHARQIRVTLTPEDEDPVGALADGSALVPEMDINDPADVKAIVAELVADYGTGASAVGSFNGFVYMDANVGDVPFGLRIVRYPTTAAEASSGSTELYSQESLFDPSGMDPSVVLELKDLIMEQAGLGGKVWDWTYSVPPQGGAPMFSYGVGESGPSQTIWLNDDGTIAEIVDGDCAPGQGFCPA